MFVIIGSIGLFRLKDAYTRPSRTD
ncbi:hypothetical protein [Alteromonas genovensis]